MSRNTINEELGAFGLWCTLAVEQLSGITDMHSKEKTSSALLLCMELMKNAQTCMPDNSEDLQAAFNELRSDIYSATLGAVVLSSVATDFPDLDHVQDKYLRGFGKDMDLVNGHFEDVKREIQKRKELIDKFGI